MGAIDRCGDIVVSPIDQPEARLVIESKNSSSITITTARREVARARASRRAGTCLTIVRQVHQSPGEAPIIQLTPVDPLIVVQESEDLERLRIAVTAGLLLARSKISAGDEAVLAARLRAGAEHVQLIIDSLADLERTARSAETATGIVKASILRLRDALTTLRERLTRDGDDRRTVPAST